MAENVHSFCTVSPPDPFDFRKPETWRKWKARFDRYRGVSGLSTRTETDQIDALLYTMGEGAEDIFAAMKLTDAQKKSFATVVTKFDEYFFPKKNVIFERAQFNRRRQNAHETVDAFVTDLHRLAETCEYGALRDELIRDRIVVGLLDGKLSERLQLDTTLTLESSISQARQSEAVKKQQNIVRQPNGEQPSTCIDAVKSFSNTRRPSNHYQKEKRIPQPVPRRQTYDAQGRGSSHPCKWCSSSVYHQRRDCPARDKVCNSCKKKGHFASVCQSTTPRNMISQDRGRESKHSSAMLEEVFVGAVDSSRNSSPWTVNILVNKVPITFKVDTGADVTVIPEAVFTQYQFSTLQAPDKILLAPSNVRLSTLGYFNAILSVRERQTAQQIYVVKDLQHCLLGRPAIVHLDILSSLHQLITAESDPKVAFPKLFSGLGCIKDQYQIVLKPDAVPFSVSTPRRVPIPMLRQVKTELERMVKLGVIVRATEPTEWCAPMVIAKKKSGAIRICASLEELNKQLVRGRTVMPTADETLGKLSGARVFSKLDANWGFWQIPLTESSQPLTTFITPFGRYKYQRLPFGISTAPEFFQMKMTEFLEGLDKQTCQLDDTLVHGTDREDHRRHLFAVLQRLQDKGLTLNPDKCCFYKNEVTFLGHLLNADGISPDPLKTRAIQEMKAPSNVREVRGLLGMVNHLAKFLPDLASKTKPLRDLLRLDSNWVWSEAQDQAFQQIKQDLSVAPVLTLYDPDKPLTVSADASSCGLGAVLLQEVENGSRLPVAYASRSLSETEERYAQVEKEALASTWACTRFRTYLLGTTFVIETDHRPLVSLLSLKRLDELSPRMQRFRMRLMEFSYSVQYVPGSQMFTADILSRAPVSPPDPLDLDLPALIQEFEALAVEQFPCSDKRLAEVRSAQEKDETCISVRKFASSQWPPIKSLPDALRPYAQVADELNVTQGVLLKGSRLVIPFPMREEILNRLHEGHLGVSRCRSRAAQSVWWPSISQEIAAYVNSCPTCSKHRRPVIEPILQTRLPDRPWQMVGMDILEEAGRSYLVVVDYFSRFFELEELRSTSSFAVIETLKPMFARHGIPEAIRSDNGPQFRSDIFSSFAHDYGFEHELSSPYYPQSNGAAERAVQTAKGILKKSPDLNKGLLAYRSSPRVGEWSPAELIFGRRLRTTVPTASHQLKPKWPDLRRFRQLDTQDKARQAKGYNARHRVRSQQPLPLGCGVWIKGDKQGHVMGPAVQPRSYLIETESGTLRRHRSHLAPREVLHPTTVQVPSSASPVQVSSSVTTSTTNTRSGRTVKPPLRLDL